MPGLHALRNALLIAALMAVAGCGSGGSEASTTPAATALPAAPGLLGLPSPRSLLGPARGTADVYEETDLTREGFHIDPAYPFNGVFPQSGKMWFTPEWDPGAAGHALSDIAYCTYHFQIPGYDRDARIILDWETADGLNTYIGVSNWERNAWDWYNELDDLNLPGGSMDPYISGVDGDLLVIVAVLGTATLKLNSVHIGTYPPLVDLTVSADHGTLPFSFVMDAGASSDPEGLFLNFEFDPDGDGDYDSGPPSATSTYDALLNLNGSYEATVRVTNSNNVSTLASVTVHAVGEWVRTWGTAEDEQLFDSAVGPDGMLYAVGETSSPQDLLVGKWTPAGELVWMSRFDSFFEEGADAVELDSDGNLIVAGTIKIGDLRYFQLQKWFPSGDLGWSFYYGGSDNADVTDLILDGTTIYLAGNTDYGQSDRDALLMKLDTQANVLWQRHRDSGGRDEVLAATRIVGVTGFTGVSLLVESDYSGDTNFLRIEYSALGNVTSESELGTSAQPKRYGSMVRSYNLLTGTINYYVVGLIDTGLGDEVFISRTDGSGANVWAHEFINLTNCFPRSISLTTNGNLVASGFLSNGPFSGWSITVDPATGACPWTYSWEGLSGNTIFSDQARTTDLGVFFCGSMVDNGYSYLQSLTQQTDMNLAWSNHANSGGTALLERFDGSGNFWSVGEDGVIDTGGGGTDAMVWLKPNL